jgi:TatA/E family protein of Tat protein translocase
MRAGDVSRQPHSSTDNCHFCFNTSFMEKFMFLRDLLIPSHLFLILGLFMLFFGGKKLPELGKGLGDGIRSFKSSVKEITKAE